MYIANVTDYGNITPTNCTDNEYNIDILIPTLLFTKLYGLSFLCFLSLIVYTLIIPLFNKKKKIEKNFIPKSSSAMYHNRFI